MLEYRLPGNEPRILHSSRKKVEVDTEVDTDDINSTVVVRTVHTCLLFVRGR